MSATQKAIVIKGIGKPVQLVDDWPVPEPGPGQVQLKVLINSLNPYDQKTRDVAFFVGDRLPALIGMDVVGTVVKLGPGVTTLAIGDRIMTQASPLLPGFPQQGLQERSVADALLSARIPSSISSDAAATLPCNSLAGVIALFSVLQLPAPWTPEATTFDYPGTQLLIIGGGTSCGKYAAQLARLAGIGTIVVVGGDEAELRARGATHFVDRHQSRDAVLAAIRAVVGDDLLYAYDCAGGLADQILPLNALSSTRRGALARLLPLGPVDDTQVLGKKAGYDVRDVFGSAHANPELAQEYWKRLPGYLESGVITPVPYDVRHGMTAENVNGVFDRYLAGEKVVKTNIHVS